ncbi:hypothetical protein PISMIDRAFT_682290 [Pisolithus microcarpus 441]|uniref:Uncharacterized protein n=1 Tax=Pisolithus microcarpus 441 TaxID=765257 RepID=A0A0C9YUT9_9AGAM|nr:hypothetical protein PISMIDRAFT_682290 [Pisolithus microcarpus 441]
MISLSTSLFHYESPKAGTPAGYGTHPVQWDEYGTMGAYFSRLVVCSMRFPPPVKIKGCISLACN